jgi:hypothetical protein
MFFELAIMSIHTLTEKSGMYFITFTCYNWLPRIKGLILHSEVKKKMKMVHITNNLVPFFIQNVERFINLVICICQLRFIK